MKKVLIGLGIGCGLLILLGVGGMVAVGFWAKGKVEGSIEAAEKMQAQEKELAALDKAYAFTPPAEGQPLALVEDRLVAYLEVREAASVQFDTLSKELEAKTKDLENRKDMAAVNDAFKMVNQMVELAAKVRATLLVELERKKMSPKEFRAITGAIFSSVVGQGMEELEKGAAEANAKMAERIAAIDTELKEEGLAEEQKSALEAEKKALVEAQASAAKGMADMTEDGKGGLDASKKGWLANGALLEKHKARIEKAANPTFDAFLLEDGMGISNSPATAGDDE